MVAIIVPAMMPGGIFDVAGATAAAAGFSLTYTDNRTDTSSSLTVTYNSGGDPSCGAADANRIVVVAMGRRITSTNPPSSVTIGGVAATRASGAFISQIDGSLTRVIQSDIWYAAVPTGTTCSVVVAWDPAGTGAFDSTIGVYRLITATPTPTASANAGVSNGGTVTLPAYTVPSGGASVNFFTARDTTGATGITWTNTSSSSGDFFAIPSGRGSSGSRVLVAGSVTVSGVSNVANIDANAISAVAWGP